jgi:hypothetical protein
LERPAVEAFLRTLAFGLRRPLVGPVPWVGVSVVVDDDRGWCGLFVSGGVSSAQVRAGLEQALPGATVETAEPPPVLTCGAGARGGVFASLRPVGSAFLPLRSDYARVDPAGQVLAALRAQAAGEGGVVQLVLQAPSRSLRRRARAEARALRAGRDRRPLLGGRALSMLALVLEGMVDTVAAFTDSSRRQPRQSRPVLPPDPWLVDRARAIEAKAAQPLFAASIRLGAWAPGRRAARGRLRGVVAAFGQFHELGGLRRGREPFCAELVSGCVSAVRPRLVLTTEEAASVLALPESTAVAAVGFAQAPARRVAPIAQAPRDGLLVGVGDRSGFDREVRVSARSVGL